MSGDKNYSCVLEKNLNIRIFSGVEEKTLYL
jgi:hypothetical protein